MKKVVKGKKAMYGIGWSKDYQYNRITAGRILPELPGIICFSKVRRNVSTELLLFADWREGLRTAVRQIFDPFCLKHEFLRKKMAEENLYYKYCIVDSNRTDLQNIFFLLVDRYQPVLNQTGVKQSPARYDEISVFEKTVNDPLTDIIIPGVF